MDEKREDIWAGKGTSKLLDGRMYAFWNPDYLERIVVPMLNLQPGARVLDTGCGGGALTILLAKLLPEVHFTGVDLSPELIAHAREQASSLELSNVEFQVADALDLPFPGGSFDSAVCQTLLLHLADPGRAVHEMARVLRSGGTFMAAEYHTLSIEWPIDPNRPDVSDEDAELSSHYFQALVRGFRKLNMGDLRIGGRVPFLAVDAGLEVVDVRINDRLLYSFPPSSDRPGQSAARDQAQATIATHADPQWRSWLASAMTAGGGDASDVDRFLAMLPDHQRTALLAAAGDFSFVWLLNPVVVVTVARRQ